MSRCRGAEHSHNAATAVRANLQRSHAGKGHRNDKRPDTPAVARLREKLGKVRV